VRFWFAPADPIGLCLLRILAGLLFLAWLLPLAGHVDELFGLNGWFDRQAYSEAGRLPGGMPQPLSWSVLYLCGTNHVLVLTTYWLSLAAIALFTAGLWTRLTGLLTWLAVASFTAPPAIASDADAFLLILAFYLMIGYVLLGLIDRSRSLGYRILGSGDTLAIGRRLLGRDAPQRTSVAANLSLRMLQVHFAVAIVISGLHKLQFGDWWAGLALWYPLHPAMEMTPTTVGSEEQIHVTLGFLGVAAYAVLAWQIGFPAFAWRQRCRPLLLGGALVGCLGCAFWYRIPVMGPALLIGCLSYVTAEEWYRLAALLRGIPGVKRIRPQFSAPLIRQGMR
jgi:hypothetical protein